MIENNTISGKPIYYYKNVHDLKIPTDAGEVILANCTNMTVEGVNTSYGTVGIQLAYTNNSEISNNKALNNRRGIYLIYSNNNDQYSNNCSNNDDGILFGYSNNNCISKNS